MRAILCITLALVAGCSTKSVCADFASSSCLAATVKGDVAKVDQLRVTIDFPSTASKDSPTTPTVLHLPVELAISLPAAAAGHAVRVFVEALSAGTSVATSAPWVGTAPAVGKPIDVTFELGSSNGDGGSATVSLAPSPLAFGQTGVGKTATSDVTVTNGTGTAVTLGAATLTGTTDFAFGMAQTTGAMACGGTSGALVVPAQSSCRVEVSFTPSKVGAAQGTFAIPYGGGSLSLDVSGVGVAIAFVDETLSTMVDFTAVSGAGTTIYAVGSSPNDCVAIWSGAAWASNCTGIANTNLRSVFALDATDVWVGGTASSDGIAFSTSGTSWTPGMVDSSVVVSGASFVGLYAVSATQVYAVESSEPGRVLSSGNGMNWLEDATPLTGSIATIASNGTTLMVAGEDGQVAFNMTTNGAFQPSAVPSGVSSSITIPSAWGAPGGAYYFVSQTDASSPKWAVFSISAGTSSANELYELSDASLYLNAIAGRPTAADGVELYAVGGLNSQILHGTSTSGSFTWTLDPLPLGDPLNAVWVGATGEVVAVGAKGIIEHLH